MVCCPKLQSLIYLSIWEKIGVGDIDLVGKLNNAMQTCDIEANLKEYHPVYSPMKCLVLGQNGDYLRERC